MDIEKLKNIIFDFTNNSSIIKENIQEYNDEIYIMLYNLTSSERKFVDLCSFLSIKLHENDFEHKINYIKQGEIKLKIII